MATTHRLCANNALIDNSTLEINIEINKHTHPGFLLVTDKKVFCYINSCPHTGATLNWNPNQFLDVNQEFIQCSLHGALFEKSSGLCIRGPCVGTNLQVLPVELREEFWYLSDDDVKLLDVQTGYSDNSLGT